MVQQGFQFVHEGAVGLLDIKPVHGLPGPGVAGPGEIQPPVAVGVEPQDRFRLYRNGGRPADDKFLRYVLPGSLVGASLQNSAAAFVDGKIPDDVIEGKSGVDTIDGGDGTDICIDNDPKTNCESNG